MRRAVRHVAVGLLVLSLGGAWVAAEEKARDKEGPLDTQAVVKKVGEINQAEMALGKLALQRTSRPDVKQYAEKLVKDHALADRQLLQLAAKNNWVVAGAPDEKHRALAQKMAQLEGKEFDKEFIHHMVMGHRKAIQLFEAQARSGENADLKAFAEKMLPTLREHLKGAEKLEGDKGKTDRGGS
jgi:putative membrane protein